MKRILLLYLLLCVGILCKAANSDVVTSNPMGYDILFSTSGSYEWSYDETNKRLQSTNYGINSSTSKTTITLSNVSGGYLSFDYKVSSEDNYDKLTITLNGQTIVNAISGQKSANYKAEVGSGTHTLVLSYTKNSSQSKNDDRAYISNLQFNPGGACNENISWEFSGDGELTISGTGSMPDYGVEYDSTDDYYYANYSSPFSYSTGEYDGHGYLGRRIKSIKIGEGITGIGSYTFHECINLLSVSLPSTLTYISQRAFYMCTSLNSVTCFATNPPSIGYDALYGSTKGTLYVKPNSIATYSAADGWKEFNIEKYGPVVKEGKCGTNVNYTLNDAGVLTISGTGNMWDSNALWGQYTSSIESVIINRGVTNIGEEVFRGCDHLSRVSIPRSVTSIGKGAFYNCENLTSITLPSSLTSIGENAFGGSGLTTVTIPNSMTIIGEYAFYGCPKLTSVTIPQTVTEIKDYAFEYCSELPSINIPNSVKNIGTGAFAYCEKLTSITFPTSVVSIGHNALESCTALTSVTIGKSVTSIGGNIFRSCDNLTSITIDSENSQYDSRENCNAIIITSSNTLSAGCKNTVIPIGIQTIYGFSTVKGLVSIDIPKTVTNIGGICFRYCYDLETISIPNSVTSIGDYAFEECRKLETVIIGKSVTNIGESAFRNCYGLTSLTCLAAVPPILTSYSGLNYTNCNILHVLPGCRAAYENADYWKNFTIVEDAVDPCTRTITFGASEYATYCSDANLDFSEVEGIKAYIASSYNPGTGSLTITRVDNVPAGEGMLLKGTAGESYDVPTTDDASVVANLLKGNTTTITLNPTDGDNTNFVLSQNNEGVIGFYRFNNSFSMPANKAWLQIPTSALGGSPAQARGFRFVEEDDELTGISDVEWKSADNNIIYDLQGRRINSQPTRGLYIQNGKKILK